MPEVVADNSDTEACPLCVADPDDPTLHTPTCRTVTEDLCGVIADGQMCMKSEHTPDHAGDNAAWARWHDDHEWVTLAAVVASTMEPCAEFGEHPRGGHAEAVREAAEWGKCWECGSSRKGCNDKDTCCAECQTTAGLTHVISPGQPAS